MGKIILVPPLRLWQLFLMNEKYQFQLKTLNILKSYPSTSKTTRNLPFHTRKLEFKYFFSELLHVDDFIEIYIITKTAEIIKEERWHQFKPIIFTILGDIRGLTISAQSLVISKFSVKIVPNLPAAGEKQFVCHVGLNAVSPSYYSSSTLSQKANLETVLQENKTQQFPEKIRTFLTP